MFKQLSCVLVEASTAEHGGLSMALCVFKQLSCVSVEASTAELKRWFVSAIVLFECRRRLPDPEQGKLVQQVYRPVYRPCICAVFLVTSRTLPPPSTSTRPEKQQLRKAWTYLPHLADLAFFIASFAPKVHDKLEEEARVRLEIARELKEEKRKRWKAEDDLNQALTRELQLEEQIKKLQANATRLLRELDDEVMMKRVRCGCCLHFALVWTPEAGPILFGVNCAGVVLASCVLDFAWLRAPFSCPSCAWRMCHDAAE